MKRKVIMYGRGCGVNTDYIEYQLYESNWLGWFSKKIVVNDFEMAIKWLKCEPMTK
jgi:hypothetical protein